MSELKFIALSGTISVTENLYIYEANDKMMIVDCGVGFPDIEMHGVDLVIPDFSYVVKNKEKLVGIVLSQGHEDHIGALPFLLREVRTQIYAAPFVTEFLKDKFKDHGLNHVQINTFNLKGDSFDVGPFKVHPFQVAHSIPDTAGFAIDTPQGRIFHVPEHKMVQDPVDGMPFDTQRAMDLGKKDVLFLASDCLGANKPGFTESERPIEDNMLAIIKDAKEAVFTTAISSNIGRFQQMINVAQKTNRKVVFVGRSVLKKTDIAKRLGYLKYPKGQVISLRDASRFPKNKLMYIVAGCYGQIGSSLYRIALGEYDRLEAQEGDTMVFSADPAPPYTKESENFIIDKLIDAGLDVHYYDLKEGLYVSGHGGQEDIIELFKITNPKYLIPIGGSVRFMHAYKKLAIKFGVPEANIFELKPGDNITFKNGQAIKGKRIPTKKVLVHGLGIGDVGKVVLGDRDVLGKEGMAVVVIKISAKSKKIIGTPEIISRGFVFERNEKAFLASAGKQLRNQIEARKQVDKKMLKSQATEFLGKFFFKEIGRKPMVLPVIVEI